MRSKEYVENPKIATEGIHLVPDVKVKDLKDNKKLEEIGYEFSSSKLFDGKESHPQLNVKEDVGKFLSDRSKSLQEKYGIDLRIESDVTNQIIANAFKSEYNREMSNKKNAQGWYKGSIEGTMDIAQKIHPELKNKDNAASFKLGMAITSNGVTVRDNTRLAHKVYEFKKENGRYPENLKIDMGEGQNRPAIEQSFKAANKLINRIGEKEFNKFLMSEFDVKSIRDAGIHGLSAELPESKVSGSAIFGPKIGGAFFQNLMGNFKPITMDMHLSRNFFRIIGDVWGSQSPKKQLEKFRNAIRSNSSLRKKYNITNDVLKDDAALIDIAGQIHKADVKSGWKKRLNPRTGKIERSKVNKTAQRLWDRVNSLKDAPSPAERRRLVRILEMAREQLGVKDNAELQAT